MHFRSNGWSAEGLLGPTAEPAYWRLLEPLGGAHLSHVERATPLGWCGVGLLFASFAGLVAAYGVIVRRVLLADRAGTGGELPVLRLAAFASLPLLLTPYMLSSDIYSYVLYGRIFAVHDGNPYLERPDLYGEDPFLGQVYWNDARMIYGPVWLYPTALVTWLLDKAGAGMGTHALVFKSLMLGCHLGAAALIGRIAARLRPRLARTITVAYALNPLCLIELAGNGHIDGFVILLLLAAIHAHAGGRVHRAALFLAMASLTKPHMALLLALYGLGHLRAAPTLAAAGGRLVRLAGLVAGVVVLAYAPVWSGTATLQELFHGSAASRNLNSIAEWLILQGAPAGKVRPLLVGAFIAAGLGLAWRTRSTGDAVRAFGWVALAFCMLASTWFWPWYVAFAVALSLAAGSRRAIAGALTLSVTAPLLYLTFGLGNPAGGVLRTLVRELHEARALLIFVPAALAIAAVRHLATRISTPTPT